MMPVIEIPPQYGIPFLGVVVVAILGYLGLQWRKRREEQHPAAPSIVEMWDRMDKLETRLEESETRERLAIKEAADAKAETTELRQIIARWFTQLRAWNKEGPMPQPSLADMRKLGIKAKDTP